MASIYLDILKIGIPGFVFLLSYLAFRLLSKEQQHAEPRKDLLKAINRFMTLSIVLALIVGTFTIVEKYWISGKIETIGLLDLGNHYSGIFGVDEHGTKLRANFELVEKKGHGNFKGFIKITVPGRPTEVNSIDISQSGDRSLHIVRYLPNGRTQLLDTEPPVLLLNDGVVLFEGKLSGFVFDDYANENKNGEIRMATK